METSNLSNIFIIHFKLLITDLELLLNVQLILFRFDTVFDTASQASIIHTQYTTL